jgi:inosine/xanthosine triphosphate pyrophosphatase family protein/dephospho-CoA kinase
MGCRVIQGPELRRYDQVALAPVLFATSNIAKFFQARLVLNSLGFRAERFEAHARAYREPYGLPTKEFLASGLREVISRAGARRLVFIEDTTVRINALSRGGEDFPGQATKEWFAASSHAEVISSIDESGGDLRASVTSDIALYVPGYSEFLYFSGVTQGRLAPIPNRGEDRRLYPWLGRDDFSSWFIPDGASRTLASMSFEESKTYDFRVKAFTALAARLAEYEKILQLPGDSLRKPAYSSTPDQFTLIPGSDSEIIIAIIGPLAAGKTTAGHHLAMNREFRHIEGSRVLSEVAETLGITASDHFGLADKTFSQYGFDAVEREALEPLIANYVGPIAYTGARTIEGLANLQDITTQRGRRLAIIYVSSSLSTRTVRAIERGRADLARGGAGKFAESSRRDASYGAATYGPVICDWHVRNDADITKFLSKIDDAVVGCEVGHKRSLPAQGRRLLDTLLNIRAGDQSSNSWLQSVHPDLLNSHSDKARPITLNNRGIALLELLVRRNDP